MAASIAVFGSAFNPPHRGHFDAVEQALAVFDQVYLVPSYRHAFGKIMASFNDRLAMLGAFMDQHPFPAGTVCISDIERSLAAAGDRPVYSFDVLEALERLHPGSRLTMVIGPDNAEPAQWALFYRGDDIQKRWGCFVTEERIKVRSTMIRECLTHGDEISPALLPSTINHYIQLHRLYQEKANAA